MRSDVPQTTPRPPETRALAFAAALFSATLDDKITGAERRGQRYTPSQDEWEAAGRSQRGRMTWPANVLNWIRRHP